MHKDVTDSEIVQGEASKVGLSVDAFLDPKTFMQSHSWTHCGIWNLENSQYAPCGGTWCAW